MKAPFRVPAHVAEELRRWLTSELEPHGISNIEQYAHHVVTIFLNEDLDIEDEPVGTTKDYMRDVYSLRSRKSLDAKKRKAVILLTNLARRDGGVDKEMRRIIDELIVRIEATKETKPSPRKVLGTISVNSAVSGNGESERGAVIEQEKRYNKAFPSLSIEVEKNNIAAHFVSSKDSSLSALQNPFDNQNKPPLPASYIVTFTDMNEAHACFTASVVFSHAMSDRNLPSPDTMEVLSSNLKESAPTSTSQNSFYRCWKSAFESVNPTKLFSPNTNNLPPPSPVFKPEPPRQFNPVVIEKPQSLVEVNEFRTLLEHVDLLDPSHLRAFLHIEPETPEIRRKSPISRIAMDDHDLEVANLPFTRKWWDSVNMRVGPVVQVNENVESIESIVAKFFQEQKNLGSQSADENTDQDHVVQDEREESPEVQHHQSPLLGAVGGRSPSPDESEEGVQIMTNDLVSFGLSKLEQLRERQDNGYRSERSTQRIKPDPMTSSTDSGSFQSNGDSSPSEGDSHKLAAHKATWEESSFFGLDAFPISWRKTPGKVQSESSEPLQTAIVDDIDEYRTDGFGEQLKWEHLMTDVAWSNPNPVVSPTQIVPNETNIFRSPEICSGFDPSVSQILQNILVNSMFNEYQRETTSSNYEQALSCSQLENTWLSGKSEGFTDRSVVKGITCSNWLENKCHLGLSCPFSHPCL